MKLIKNKTNQNFKYAATMCLKTLIKKPNLFVHSLNKFLEGLNGGNHKYICI